LDSEDRWARLPGEVGKAHVDTSMVELGQKTLWLLQTQHVEGLGLRGSLISLVTEMNLCLHARI